MDLCQSRLTWCPLNRVARGRRAAASLWGRPLRAAGGKHVFILTNAFFLVFSHLAPLYRSCSPDTHFHCISISKGYFRILPPFQASQCVIYQTIFNMFHSVLLVEIACARLAELATPEQRKFHCC